MLGAGGVLGGAWLVGMLRALHLELGWEPASADVIVGTSAGSVMGALLAGGVTAEGLLPASARILDGGIGEQPDADPEWILFEVAAQATYRFAAQTPRPLPGSLGLCLAGILRPSLQTPVRLISGLAPKGLVPTEPIKNTVRRAPSTEWPVRPACRIVACDYDRGQRVVFGAPDAPSAALPDAVAASCAIPGYFEPQRIGGRLYVDGGLHSMSNLDLLAGEDLDLVVCLNPMSSVDRPWRWGPLHQLTAALGRLAHWQLRHEAEQVKTGGAEVVLLEPTGRDITAMGPNLMDAARAEEVALQAIESGRAQLRSLRSRFAALRYSSAGGGWRLAHSGAAARAS